MSKPSCIVIDDEPLAVLLIADYIKREGSFELKATCTNPSDALQQIKKNDIDIIYTDIQMPELTGIQLMQQCNKSLFVIVSAYPQFAVQGFDFDATDYLLKPVTYQRFCNSVEKIKKRLQLSENAKIESHILVKADYKLQKINTDDIIYIEGARDYIFIYTHNGRVMTLQSMRSIMQDLPQGKFIQIHKSYIVTINKIKVVQKNQIQVGDHTLPLSSTYKTEVLEAIKQLK